ncbi:MAG: hypothetical protein JXA18_11035 [Chitinispirillaceae bacterium]|nr:hypothetical protein [Chitinispirillaceae bacterium]
MKKVIFIGVLLAGAVYAQEIPEGVQRIMNDYKKDTIGILSFNTAQKTFKFDSSITISDIEIGVPYEEYILVKESLLKLPDTVPVQSVIAPCGVWQIPIRAKGKYIYFVRVSNSGGTWKFAGMGEPLADWQKIREAWPESSGNNPIFISKGRRCFLHFPNQGGHNLFYLSYSYPDDSLALITSREFGKLDDSRIIFNYLKKAIKKRKN